MKTCSIRETNVVNEECSDSTLIAPAENDFYDTIQDESISSVEDSSLYIRNADTSTKKNLSILEELWKALIFPDYSEGLTGFGWSLMITEMVIQSGIPDATAMIFLLIPISLILALLLAIIPIQNIKLLLTLSTIGCFSLYLFLILIQEDLDKILYGFWISLITYPLNVLILLIKSKVSL